tara:strand:+ start:599 stop:868 length:270 start_codon:yes stop_codon:yes gene_type:complete
MTAPNVGQRPSAANTTHPQPGIAPNAPYMPKRSFNVNYVARKAGINEAYLRDIHQIRFNGQSRNNHASRASDSQPRRELPPIEKPNQTQ